jgi:branched-chain amino acid transport system substrate-binding protein
MSKCIKSFVVILYLSAFSLLAEDKILYIYQDADLSNHSESSEAIQKGIEVAFNEINNQIEGYNIAFKYLDHRGNVIRSKRNYQLFLTDPNALAIYSGIHSPPLIRNRDFINTNKALTLVPWAAGGPITRYPSKENWIFRLSVDDTQAGPVIIDFAIKTQKCRNPHLLLEETPWGNSNLTSMTKALKKYSADAPKVTRFSWNLKAKGAREVLGRIRQQGSDCIILVSNAVEGAVIVSEVFNLPKSERLPIISHWGITGGNFHEKVSPEKRGELELHFIQSCFSFTNKQQSPLANNVFLQLVEHSQGAIEQAIDLKSAVGFIHAYDLSKLLINAIKQAGITGNISVDRNAIRLALEELATPIQGLVKTYNKPFSAFDEKQNFNGHEALSEENYCMGQFGQHGEVLISEGN